MEQLEVKAFGFEVAAKRKLFHLALPTLDAYPAHLPLYSPNFTLFLACDSQRIPIETLSDFAESVLAQGAVYICTWGPDCEHIHDIFDETIVEHQINLDAAEYVPSDVMTTWHSDETLEDALDFFLTAANPDDAFLDKCRAAIAVSIGNHDWANQIGSVMLSQVPREARTYIYSSSSNGRMWMRDDFDEPLEEFAEYM